MAGGVIAPVLPELVQQLHLDPVLAGSLVSMHCLTIALFSLPLGILADRIGRLQVLVPSLVLYALFGMAGALIPSFVPLLVTRGLLGVASGGIAAASLGFLGNLYEGQRRSQAISYTASTLAVTGIIFPLLGGLIGEVHWQFAFCFYGLGLPLALLAAIVLREEQQIRTEQVMIKDRHKLAKVLRRRHVLRLLITLGLVSATMYAVIIYLPLYLHVTIGAGVAINGVVLASQAIGAAGISAFGARRLAQSLGVARTLAVSFGLMAMALATIPLLHQLSGILLAAVLFGMGFGIVLPNLYTSLANLAPLELQSSVLAAGIGASFLGQFLSPILLGPVLGYSGLVGVFYAATSLSLFAGFLLLTPGE
jgi:predicted MFS family arabinose efflux permease